MSTMSLVLGGLAGAIWLLASASNSMAQDAGIRWHTSRLEVPLQVNWETTRSDMSKEGIATHSEHFRETWFFVIRPGTDTFLRSPRAEVQVTGVGYPSLESELPGRVVLAEEDFAKLLGIPLPPADEEFADDSSLLMTLKILDAAPKGEEFTIYFSRDDFIALHLEIEM